MGEEAGQALSRQEEGFLAEVRASPEDEAPRLVYADWLEENDQPERAEFIRLQCERARLRAYDPRQGELQKRERQLLREHGRAWCAPVAARGVRCEFRRGFLEELRLNSSALLKKNAP